MTVELDQFQRRVSHVARGCPTAVLRDAILQAAEDFCERTWLWRETLEMTTVDGQEQYTLVPPRNADILAVVSVALGGGNATFTAPARDIIDLGADPGAARDLEVTVALKPTKTAKTLPALLYNQWLDAIASSARAKLLDMPGAEWFHPQLAEKYRAEFERVWVPRARVEVAHRDGRPLSVRKRRFI